MNYKKQSIKQGKAIVALSIALISSAAIASPTFAETTVFSGNMCRPVSHADTLKVTSGGNNIFNLTTSTSSAKVDCPMSQRVPSDTNKTATRSRIRLFKTNNQEVSCTLFSSDSSGGTLGSSTVKSTASGSTTMTTSFVPKGHYYGLACNLPPGNGIAFYDLL
jgi:hypothetical protein